MKTINGNPLTKKQLFGILESCWGLVSNRGNEVCTYDIYDQDNLESFELFNGSYYQTFKVDTAQSVADGELLQLEDMDGKTFRFIVLFNQNIEDLR